MSEEEALHFAALSWWYRESPERSSVIHAATLALTRGVDAGPVAELAGMPNETCWSEFEDALAAVADHYGWSWPPPRTDGVRPFIPHRPVNTVRTFRIRESPTGRTEIHAGDQRFGWDAPACKAASALVATTEPHIATPDRYTLLEDDGYPLLADLRVTREGTAVWWELLLWGEQVTSIMVFRAAQYDAELTRVLADSPDPA